MSKETPTAEKGRRGSLILFSVAFAYFATFPMDNMWTLLLVEIASTLQVTVGAAGQIRTASTVATVVFAVLTGILSIRYRHKSLLLIGVLCMIISALGCFLAPSLSLVQIFNFLNGVGSVMVGAMAITLIGDFLPLVKRGMAVSVIQATTYFALFVGTPITGLIASIGGWRSVLIVFQLPVSVAGLVLAFFGLPSTSQEPRLKTSKETYLNGFKQVLFSKSPAGCFVGLVLRAASAFAITLYVVAFFKQRFLLSESFGVGIIMGEMLLMILSNLVAGRLVNRFGRKPLTVLTTLLWGIFIISFFYVPNLWIALTLFFTGWWFGGMALSASSSLALEQVPEFRGTMMSLNVVFLSIGGVIGGVVGGIVLDLFSYEVMGLIVGLMSIASAIVYYLLTKDPYGPSLQVAGVAEEE
jgi:DHA1 family putative efflux transporter-like MFS transporter